jgi:hypothetical protein
MYLIGKLKRKPRPKKRAAEPSKGRREKLIYPFAYLIKQNAIKT